MMGSRFGKRVVSRAASVALAIVAPALTIPGRVEGQQVAYAASLVTELDSATQEAVVREIARARERGLPVEPLVAKVREGRLKRAPGLRIRSAVEKLGERLNLSRGALGSESSAAEVIAGADALAAGADATSLRALRAASPRSIAAPLGTLAQLIASGVDQRKAVEMIVKLLQRNAAPAQLIALGNLVEADVASGLRPEESAAFRLRSIEGSLGFGDKVELAQPAAAGTGDAFNGQPRGTAGQPRGAPKRRP